MAHHDNTRVFSERQLRWLLNLYPPMLFNRVRVREFGPGFRHCRVRVARSLLTRNLNGSTFGASIFTGADPIYAMMYWQIFARLGEPVQVWLKSARIQYRKPADSALTLEFELDERQISEARSALQRDGRFTPVHRTEAVDRSGDVCAVIDTEVHLRHRRPDQKQISAF